MASPPPSRRLPADLSVNALTRTLAAIRARGIEVADLTLANPTQAGFDYPPDLLTDLSSAASFTYDPHPRGLATARAAVAADFARRGLDVSAEAVTLAASTSEAYAWLFKLLCDPGDEVLIPRPSYPLFEHLALLEGVDARPYRLEYHGTWRIDLDHVAEAVGGRTRAIVVVAPNNPTGSFLHADDLAALDELCAARNLMLIGDEVFADYVLEGSAHAASVLQASQAVSCSLGGLSKSVGLPQLKLGWMAMGGPPATRDPLLLALDMIADTFLSVSTPVQVAAPALLTRGGVVREQIQARTRRNLAALRQAAAGCPEVEVLSVEGGWSATLRVPRYRSEESLVLELLTADHVLVHPGFFFDFEHEAFLVVSLLTRPAIFDAAIARLLARVTARVGPS